MRRRADGRLRVLQLGPHVFGPDGVCGGAERYAWELSRVLAARTPTRLVGFGRRPGHRREGLLEQFTLRNQLPGWRFASSPASLGLLPHLAWADVVHCHQIYAMSTSVALLYGRCSGKPVFVTDHAGGGWSLQQFLPLDAWFAGRLWVSAFSRGAHAPRPGDRVIGAGVDVERFRPAPSEPEGERPVLFAGRVLPVKSVDLLLRAVDASTAVTVLGPEPDAAYARQLRALARGKRVQFQLAVEGEALARAYQQAACVVLPGVETLGLALLEAMACSTPVICSSASGLPEFIRDGVEGYVFAAGDAAALREKIGALLQHPETARAMGAAGRRRVLRDLTWPAVAERCLEAYRSAACATDTSTGASTRHSSAGSISTR